MKKIALLLVFVFLFSFSTCFADIIAPEADGVESVEPSEGDPNAIVDEVPEGEAQEIEVTSEEEVGTLDVEPEDVASGEFEPVNEETNEETVEPEKTSNPVGGIVAIVVVVVLVLLVALVSKK